MPMKDPDWLVWARELQAIAQTGLMFCRDPYDRERYEAIRQLAARIFAARTDAPGERIEALFAGETGYPTPKVDVRAAVFDHDERILMVRETSDGGRWTLRGGWAGVNLIRFRLGERAKTTHLQTLLLVQNSRILTKRLLPEKVGLLRDRCFSIRPPPGDGSYPYRYRRG